MTAPAYTRSELMVAAAAREIRNGEIAFVGMRLPLLAFLLAKATHAPDAVALYENGILRETPAREILYTMGDGPNLVGATMLTGMGTVMGLLEAGRARVGFIGAAEIDRFGNLNTTEVRAGEGTVRLPGSGGASDIASLAGRLVVILAHEKRRFRERVHYVTSPGHGDGRGFRKRAGLPGGGPSAVITTLGVLRFGEDGETFLDSVHPGVSAEDARRETGWDLKVRPDLETTPPPTADELRVMREIDPEGFWTK
jgi:glutaconate CoA-transferase subunit B